MSEEFAFQQIFRQGGAIDDHQGAIPTVFRRLVDRAGDHLLAGARFPFDQNGCGRLRDEIDPIKDLEHAGILAHDPFKTIPPAQFVSQVGQLITEGTFAERTANEKDQTLGVDRLREKVVGTALHRLDSAVDTPIAGHDHDCDRQLAILDFAEQVHSVDFGHPKIGDHQTVGALFQ